MSAGGTGLVLALHPRASSEPSGISVSSLRTGLWGWEDAGAAGLSPCFCRHAGEGCDAELRCWCHSGPHPHTGSPLAPRSWWAPGGHVPVWREQSVLCFSDADAQGKYKLGQIFTEDAFEVIFNWKVRYTCLQSAFHSSCCICELDKSSVQRIEISPNEFTVN